MDLYIDITDEDGMLLERVNIYQDGSDSAGAARIRTWLENNYSTDPVTKPWQRYKNCSCPRCVQS